MEYSCASHGKFKQSVNSYTVQPCVQTVTLLLVKTNRSHCKPTNLFSHHELINDGFYFILEIQCFQLTHFIRFESSPASLGLSSIKTFSNDSWVNLWMGFYGFRHMLSISIHWTIVMVLMKIPATMYLMRRTILLHNTNPHSVPSLNW